MHIVDSYLELTTAPMSIRKFNELKKEENDIRASLDSADLYIIAKREVPRISLLETLHDGVEKNDYVIPLKVELLEAKAIIYAYYVLPTSIEKKELQELKEAILDSDFEEILDCSSAGYGNIFFYPCEDIQKLFTYEVMYVGQCVGEKLSKRFKAHHALQDMLIEEKVISTGYQNSDELIILPFRSDGDICSILNPNESTFDDYMKAFTNDFSFGSTAITLDCEKALVHGMNPKYNKTRFLSYPKSDDGLYKTEADVYSYYIAANLILKYSGGMVYGCPDSIYASRIVSDKEGFTNIYAPGEDYIKRYEKKMFSYAEVKQSKEKSVVEKHKAIFLDRDGTINVEKDYLYKITDFELLPGAVEALKLLQSAGFLLIIITNQSGIARGYYKEEDYEKLNTWMLDELKTKGIEIDAVYYCPHLPNAKIEKYKVECSCRKPKLGMFEQAIKDFNIDLSESYAIGDKIRDCAICASTDCKGFLIANNEKQSVIDDVKSGKYERVEYAETLLAVAKKILPVG